jgi:hypothetical protein
MPNQLNIPVTAGTLPPGSCPANGDLQALLDFLVSAMSITFPSSFAGVTASQTRPIDQTQIWLQLDSLGRPIRLYKYVAGAWLAQHPLPSNFVMIWPYTLPDFTTFDGGDGNSLTATSGPMWKAAQDLSGNPILAGQVPLGVGTLKPSGGQVAVTQTGGEDVHSLIVSELAPHSHTTSPLTIASANGNYGGSGPLISNLGNGGSDIQPVQINSTGGLGTPPVVVPHNTLPPYYGVYFIQRTSRQFYAVT